MAVLSLENVVIRYGSHVAVAGLSLQVRAGEIYGLLGPNGCGKSSTIGAVAGDRPYAEGCIRLGGLRERDAPLAYRRRLGLVPQELALYEDLSARRNLHLFGRLYGLAGASLKLRIDEVLGFARLSEHADRVVRTFSGGMQRRLNLACALMHAPPLLLLDEPTVGLDVQSRDAVFACLRALRDGGTAMVFTTHHLAEAELLCDRVGIMDQGRLIAAGTPAELCAGAPTWRVDAAHGPRQPRLERVFLDLTGRSVREA
ncbi:MAG: ABC transporter ATP-binding protein [Gemmataceae bacterium]